VRGLWVGGVWLWGFGAGFGVFCVERILEGDWSSGCGDMWVVRRWVQLIYSERVV
jgi:hypothetical protein